MKVHLTPKQVETIKRYRKFMSKYLDINETFMGTLDRMIKDTETELNIVIADLESEKGADS